MSEEAIMCEACGAENEVREGDLAFCSQCGTLLTTDQ